MGLKDRMEEEKDKDLEAVYSHLLHSPQITYIHPVSFCEIQHFRSSPRKLKILSLSQRRHFCADSYSVGTRTHKHSDYTKLNIHSLKRAANARETWNGYRRREQKTWQVYNFGKRNVFRLDLSESREGFCRRGRGRSFHVDGPKREKVREPAVKSPVRGIWRLRVSEPERRVREGGRLQLNYITHCVPFVRGFE